MEPDGNVQVHIKVKNTGKRPSDEVVQMYVQHLGSSVTRPQLELKGFKRVRIEPGTEKDITMQLKARDLAYWDVAAHAWRVEKEKINILAGGSSDKLPVQTTVDVSETKDFRP
jgi:beta-glucosidase